MTEQQIKSLITAVNTMNSNLSSIARKIDILDSRLYDIECIVNSFPR